jgi:hypothetical protein
MKKNTPSPPLGMGDANNHGPSDIIASDAQGIYWYAEGGKHVIDEFNTASKYKCIE